MDVRSLFRPLIFALLAAGTPLAAAAAQPPMTLDVDASEATRGLIHVHETIPAAPGPLTLVYPKWIPGEHAPNGPIADVASLVVRGGERVLPWRRDPVDLFAFRVDVPAGVPALDVSFDFLGNPRGWGGSARLSTPNILSLTWNKVVLAPAVVDYSQLQIAPSVRLPGADWQFGTALEPIAHDGAAVRFAPVSEETLIDSPLDAGVNVRKFPLGSLGGAPVELDVFADTAAETAAPGDLVRKFRALVTQMQALYGAPHFNHYTFLVTVSDLLQVEGVEHHQSSDDGTSGDYLIDADTLASEGDLLPHEFNHSWDGKYRRPADLATPNLQVPMQDDLLWVYEGMTEFYGQLQAERSGLWTKQQWLDALAETYAELDTTTGRATRPLLDTAVSASILYGAGQSWAAARRGVDFYTEGELMWLEADVTIRRRSNGRHSLDDLARAFFGRERTGPQVLTYTRADVVAALDAVQPGDWDAFLTQRVDTVAPHPPDPFSAAGWRLVYAPEPTALAKAQAQRAKLVDVRYSLGFVARQDGTLADVIPGSPAARAGLSPGLKVVALNGRALGSAAQAQLDGALRAAQQGANLHVLVVGGDVYRDAVVDYHGGPRFPRLERIAGTPDLLSVIAAARR